MIDWWNSLSLALQIFFGIGIGSLLLTVLQLVLSLVGIGGELLDFDGVDTPDGDGSSGASLISMQTLSAFFMGFGWFGAALLSAGIGLMLAIVSSIVIGLILMAVAYFFIRQLLRLQSSGNINYASAIGEEATVYVTLPGNDEDGGGQIQLMIQGRLRTAAARKPSPGSAKPGEKVRITGMFAQTTYNVEPIHGPSS